MLQVQLNRRSGIRVGELQERLRKMLPQELPGVRFSFEPSDIVSRVMSFGAPTPIEVAVSGPDFDQVPRSLPRNFRSALANRPSLRDLGFEQELDYPAVKVDIDRQMAGMLGVTADQIGHSLTEATSSSRFTVPNFWPDPRSGVGYQVQVQIPTRRMNSLEDSQEHPGRTQPEHPDQSAQRGRRHQRARCWASTTATTCSACWSSAPTSPASISAQVARPCNAGARQDRSSAAGRQREPSRAGRADAGNVQRAAARHGRGDFRSSSCCWRRISNRSGCPARSC